MQRFEDCDFESDEDEEGMMKGDFGTAPSELFENCINSSGSLVIDCELCGRTHFGHGGDYDEYELESLKAKQEKDSDRYIEHDDFVSYGYIQGKQAVIGCPRNQLSKFEKWILNHKFLIIDFLSKYAAEKVNNAVKLNDAAFNAQRLMDQLRNNEAEELRKSEAKQNGRVRKFDLE